MATHILYFCLVSSIADSIFPIIRLYSLLNYYPFSRSFFVSLKYISRYLFIEFSLFYFTFWSLKMYIFFFFLFLSYFYISNIFIYSLFGGYFLSILNIFVNACAWPNMIYYIQVCLICYKTGYKYIWVRLARCKMCWSDRFYTI